MFLLKINNCTNKQYFSLTLDEFTELIDFSINLVKIHIENKVTIEYSYCIYKGDDVEEVFFELCEFSNNNGLIKKFNHLPKHIYEYLAGEFKSDLSTPFEIYMLAHGNENYIDNFKYDKCPSCGLYGLNLHNNTCDLCSKLIDLGFSIPEEKRTPKDFL